MKKIRLNDRSLLDEWYQIITPVSVLVTIFSIAVTIPEEFKKYLLLFILFLFSVLYFYLWNKANKITEKKIIVNNNILTIKFGNIFEEEGLKVIAFNEYFDTKVDDIIITNSSLNGIYINTYVENIKKLDDAIKNDKVLSEKIVKNADVRSDRKGKKNIYELGSIFRNNDYLLLAFSKFDSENKASLSTSEYFNCLLDLWKKIDMSYNGKKIVIPLLGSGITRFKETNILTDQELLEFIITSLKLSKIKYLDTHEIIIIIHPTKKDNINLYNIY
ncbi:macro domain-containing protein [Exiguobacterium undae]|uniref:macro domain-containing protein n=1 Tax=Exiguobacterium undae TaxID=169177 RepID=UPI00047C130C|nr:macro domain-containing protein [Exiguobacterium undae]